MVVQVRSTGSSGNTAAGIVVLVISVIFMVVGILVPPIACVGCIMLIVGIVMISSSGGGSRAVVIQQQPAMIPMIPAAVPRQVIQRPVVPQPVPQPTRRVAPPPATTSVTNFAETARNLEKARDFDAAAKMYQKAGMYEDAGRVRQAHLEKEEQAMVQIGQVGNKVLNDSVMVGDSSAPAATATANINICEMCQNVVETGWNVCPHCQHRFDR